MVILKLVMPAQCQTHPSYFHILQCVQVLSGLNHYFFSYRVHRQLDRHTDKHTDTDGHEYSIVDLTEPTSMCLYSLVLHGRVGLRGRFQGFRTLFASYDLYFGYAFLDQFLAL